MTSLILHHYWRSSCSWRVRWALEIKGAEFKCIPVNLLQNQQRSPEYRDLHPGGLVPTLVANGQILNESLAILEWIEENYKTPPLLPEDAFGRAKVRQLALTIAAGTQPLQNLQVLNSISTEAETRKDWARKWIDAGLTVYETIVKDCAGSFSFKDQVSFADLCLIPQCYNALRFDLDLSKYPTIERIHNICLDTESCKKSSPDMFQPND